MHALVVWYHKDGLKAHVILKKSFQTTENEMYKLKMHYNVLSFTLIKYDSCYSLSNKDNSLISSIDFSVSLRRKNWFYIQEINFLLMQKLINLLCKYFINHDGTRYETWRQIYYFDSFDELLILKCTSVPFFLVKEILFKI